MIGHNISKIFVREIGKFWKADTLYILIRETNVLSILTRIYKKVQMVIFTESVHISLSVFTLRNFFKNFNPPTTFFRAQHA